MLLGAIVGLLSSAVPEIINYFQKREDYKHERELLNLRMEHAEKAAQHEINIINAQAYAKEGDSLREHDSNIDGGFFINALRASVRPVLTYFFFFVFVGVKAIAIYHGIILPSGGIESQIAITEILPLIWDEDTRAIFGAILGFWFGTRSIQKLKNKRNY